MCARVCVCVCVCVVVCVYVCVCVCDVCDITSTVCRYKYPNCAMSSVRLQGFDLSMHALSFAGIAAPLLTHLHLSHSTLDGMCLTVGCHSTVMPWW